MAVTFRKNASRETLYALAVENGVEVAEDAERAEIIAALEAYNAAEDGDGTAAGNDATPEEKPTESAQDGAGNDGGGAGATNPAPDEKPAEDAQDGAEDGDDNAAEYDTFAYIGPTLPNGRLKENSLFRGTRADVNAYLADVLERYPQAAHLIVPTSRLAAFSVKVKTPGNIAHKYYNDIVSAMRNHKEV